MIKNKWIWFCGVAIVGLLLAFKATSLTWLQYQLWSQSEFTGLLLAESGYFARYAFTHYWLGFLLSVLVALVFYFFLKILKQRRPQLLSDSEPSLALLLGLVVGWPKFVIFLALTFIIFFLLSLFNQIFRQRSYTTITWPLLLATLLTLIFGSSLLVILNLTVLLI